MHSRNCIKETAVQVMDESWNYLIILDACRYDYFERVHRNLLPNGKLTCRKSAGSATVEWRNKSFPGFYEDVVYVSANPYINSERTVEGFWGAEHFFKVIDVWKGDWDNDRGTVPPERVTRRTLQSIRDYPGKRMIIHYLQPHAPYLGFGSDCMGFPVPDTERQRVLQGISAGGKHSRREKFFARLRLKIRRIRGLGNHPDWVLAQLLCLPPRSPMDAVRRRYGKRGLRRAYEENLSIVLTEVARLIPYLKGAVVITSDHGEYLGEDRSYSHLQGSEHAILRDIPWWSLHQTNGEEIPKSVCESTDQSEAGEMEIQRRLKDLGYL